MHSTSAEFSNTTLVAAVVLGAFSVFGFTLAYVPWIAGLARPRAEEAQAIVALVAARHAT